jgi:predicted phosphodiesterase
MPLRILHLSDIHFSTRFDEERIPHTDVRDELLSDLRDVMIPKVGGIHKVLIAGDVAFSGKREEYEEAAKWLEGVTSACGCKQTDILTVPGNHDVDRSRILPAVKSIHGRLRTCSMPDAKKELLELANQKDGLLTDKLTDYQAFASIFGCHFRSLSKPTWEWVFPLGDGFSIRFVGLTTVQVCDSADEKGALLLGNNQYILERRPREELVVVMHHPPEWIKDRQEAFQYLDSRCRVQVFGHEHLQEVHLISDANQDSRLVIASGAVTPDNAHEPYIYRYNVLEFALSGDAASPHLTVTIFPRIWVPELTRFSADTNRLSGRESASFTLPCPQFRLPAAIQAGLAANTLGHENVAIEATDGQSESFAKVNYFFWRFLTWQQQLTVLVEADVLPVDVKAPSLQAIAHKALQRAKSEGKLGSLWERIMALVPVEKREQNPFETQNN